MVIINNMNMPNKQDAGFLSVEIVILIVIFLVIGVVGYSIHKTSQSTVLPISKSNNVASKVANNTKTLETSQKPAVTTGGSTQPTAIANQSTKPSSEVTLLLINAANKQPIDSTTVFVNTNNDVCNQAACPDTSNTYTGTTDAKGEVKIPAGNIQLHTTITVKGYAVYTLDFQEGKTTYALSLTTNGNR